MGSIKRILTGWFKSYGLIKTSEAEKKLSELRLSFCVSCKESKESKTLVLLRGKAENIKILRCDLCTCPCVEKSLVVSEKCPLNKW